MNTNKIPFHHIRNATTKLIYNGVTILVDPFLAPKAYYPGFDGAPTPEQKKQRVPLVDLPMSIEEIIKDLEVVIITHTHYDHWDEWAAKEIPKNVTIFVQNESDKKIVQGQGFKDARIVGNNTPFKGISITKIKAHHAPKGMNFDECMGFILKAPGQKTIYFTGDTIWFDQVENALKNHKPDIIIINGADTRYEWFSGSTMMGPEDIKKMYKMCKDSIIIPVHMDSYPHCTYTTKTMKKFVEEHKFQDRVIVPVDGEKFEI